MKRIQLLTLLLMIFISATAQTDYAGILKDKIKPCNNNENTPVDPLTGDTIQKYYAKIWPNPSIAFFNLRLESPSEQGIKVIISDLMGKLVEEFQISNNASIIFGTMFSPGLYIIRIKQGSEVMSTFKLIKQ